MNVDTVVAAAAAAAGVGPGCDDALDVVVAVGADYVVDIHTGTGHRKRTICVARNTNEMFNDSVEYVYSSSSAAAAPFSIQFVNTI